MHEVTEKKKEEREAKKEEKESEDRFLAG